MNEEEHFQTRVAWYYYVENLTQQQIATRLGTSRVRINRALSACRESGLVQIGINGALSECVELEQRLTAAYQLREAVVVPTPEDPELVTEAVGVGAGSYINRVIRDGQTLGIGWGQTVVETLRAVGAKSFRSMATVSLQGGLSHCARLNTFEIVSDFAKRLGADCYYFAAPIFASSPSVRDLLLEQTPILETYQQALDADLSLFTVGDMTRSLIVTYGIKNRGDVAALTGAGAVGDLLGHFIDAEGEPVEHELNRRTVAVALDDVRRMKHAILASGGSHKHEVTRAALKGGYADVLVTDLDTARALAGGAGA